MRRKMVLFFVGMSLIVVGCSTTDVMGPFPDVVEAEPQNVARCRRLGAISELIDPGKVFLFAETHRTKARVMQRAIDLGATHIVWEYQNKQAMAATAYYCPIAEP